MSDDTVLKLSQPSTFSDPLTEVLRSGARSLLARAVEAEVAAFLDGHSEARTEEGRRRLVRHGHLPEREIMTGIGPGLRFARHGFATARAWAPTASGSAPRSCRLMRGARRASKS